VEVKDPRPGKEKLKPLVDRFSSESNLRLVSVSTIERIIRETYI